MELGVLTLLMLLIISPLAILLGIGDIIVVYNDNIGKFPMDVGQFKFKIGLEGSNVEVYFIDSPKVESLPGISFSMIRGEAHFSIGGKSFLYEGTRGVVSQSEWIIIESYEDGSPLILVRDIDGKLVFLVTLSLSEADDDLLKAILNEIVSYIERRQAALMVILTTFTASAASVASFAIYEKYLKRVEGGIAGASIYLAASTAKIRDPLKNAVRAEIYEELKREPLTLKELKERTGLSKSSLLWHLGVLERAGLIRSDIFTGIKFYYVPGRTFDVKIKAMAMNPTRVRILKILSNDSKGDGIYLRGLAKELGMSTESIKRNLDFLEGIGLVESIYSKGRRYIRLTERGRELVDKSEGTKKIKQSVHKFIVDKVNLIKASSSQDKLH